MNVVWLGFRRQWLDRMLTQGCDPSWYVKDTPQKEWMYVVSNHSLKICTFPFYICRTNFPSKHHATAAVRTSLSHFPPFLRPFLASYQKTTSKAHYCCWAQGALRRDIQTRSGRSFSAAVRTACPNALPLPVCSANRVDPLPLMSRVPEGYLMSRALFLLLCRPTCQITCYFGFYPFMWCLKIVGLC